MPASQIITLGIGPESTIGVFITTGLGAYSAGEAALVTLHGRMRSFILNGILRGFTILAGGRSFTIDGAPRDFTLDGEERDFTVNGGKRQ